VRLGGISRQLSGRCCLSGLESRRNRTSLLFTTDRPRQAPNPESSRQQAVGGRYHARPSCFEHGTLWPSERDGFEFVIISCPGQLLTPPYRVGDDVVAEAVASIAQSCSGRGRTSVSRHL
jgi:hypothetical protein